jgi:hypothetical protein
MRWLVLITVLAALAVGCGSNPESSPESSPTAAKQTDTDRRICESALKVQPWNSPLINSLTRYPQTPIQEQARKVEDLFDANAHFRPSRDLLSQMCVDAGY